MVILTSRNKHNYHHLRTIERLIDFNFEANYKTILSIL